MEKTCKKCRYWERELAHYGQCNNKKFVENEYPPVDGLEYWDYEGYCAGFTTGENFGCIHWDKKDTTD